MKQTLLRCPFCGGKPVIMEHATKGERVFIRYLDFDGYETTIGEMEHMCGPDEEPCFTKIS